MNISRKHSLLLTLLLGAIAGPASAGNYAEGDPRPAPPSSATSRDAVAADTRRWLQNAPDRGYPEGHPRAAVSVSANSRAMVQADTLIWIRAGLAAAQNGEAGADMSTPAYRQAAAEDGRLRSDAEVGARADRITR